MGASRKLQGEIDRVLKKVQEGVDVFDSIWNKVYDTDNANQKEKFEADLKKEIKKLQRYRDQIKTWIQSTEIKDKKVSASYEQALLDARKLIEREMERFKICEKETKTKAFSKEGLGQQPKTDPKEKAKSETRDWLNNVVGELESQIDSFEAEAEGLSVKKGKTRPARLIHLETSIVRHKAHIMKLELILRLLDNDELSPEQVNDVRDFLDDYVERNQDDFDEFSDVDELYISLPLDKVESLEDLVGIGPPALVKGVTSVSTAGAVLGLKNSLSTSTAQLSATLASTTQQGTSVLEPAEETASQDSYSDVVPRTPPSKNSAMSSAVPPATTTIGSSTLAGSNMLNVSGSSIPACSLVNGPTTAAILSSPLRVNMDNQAVASQSPVNLSNLMKEDEKSSFPGHRASPALPEIGIGKGIGRGSVVGSMTNQASSVQLNSGNGALTGGTEISDMGKRNILGADERIGSGGLAQPIISSLNNRMLLQQASKANDGIVSTDSGNVADGPVMGGRVFSPPVVSGVQWRPQNANSFPNQNEMFNPQTSSLSSQVGLGLGVQSPVGLSSVPSSSVQSSMLQQSARHPLMLAGAKNADVGHVKAEDQQQQKNPHDDMISGSATNLGLVKNLMNEDDLKMPYAVDTPVAGSGSLTEATNVPRDTDLSPGQPLQSNQSSVGLGVIGRRSVSDLGAIGDNLSGSTGNSGGIHDQLYNLQMLDAAYHRLPRPKDSERAKNYIPRHLAKTPPSYPQVQAPIVDNPLFWERLSLESLGTDTLFFAFYYQQNTHQQYLAARELKRQSWRYHRKYNTWFQRHEEPKVTTDEYEQGTYVYFDFHIANDDLQHGWCQRIKTEFTFEYSYLEDELVV